MIYLASPYSHLVADVREQRFQAACRATSRLIAARLAAFSPIVFGHPLANHGLPTDWSFWEPFDREHLWRCDEVVVLTLEGWRESVGIAAELKIAADLDIPIAYLAVLDDAETGGRSQNVLRTAPCPSKLKHAVAFPVVPNWSAVNGSATSIVVRTVAFARRGAGRRPSGVTTMTGDEWLPCDGSSTAHSASRA